jgi:integrase/recombinase XerD
MTDILPYNSTSPDSKSQGLLPAPISSLGEKAQKAFVDFFTASIENDNTRKAYLRATYRFFAWCEDRRLPFPSVEPVHVAAYLKQLDLSKPSKKLHLAGLRALFDHLVVRQVVPFNPAHAVRGPRYSTPKGKTPVLTAGDMRRLFDSIDISKIAGQRDRAIIGLLTYTFARVGAVVGLRVDDYSRVRHRSQIRLNEKGGKVLDIPLHHRAVEYLEEYLSRAGIKDEKASPLFRTLSHHRQLTGQPVDARTVQYMIKRRAAKAGISQKISPHSFRATGITIYLDNGGLLEHAQEIAGHADPRTTKLYDRTKDRISLDEIEKIVI